MSSIRSRQIQTASRSDVGRVRSANQDVCGAFENAEGYRLLVVADGMGGHKGGETASQLALETIGNVFDSDFGAAETLLGRAFRAANREIHRVGGSDPALHGMGTTGVAVLIGPSDQGWVAHVGDSRAYRLRDDHLDQLTEDHSWVYEQVRRGLMTAEEADEHPMKNVLLRSIGVGSDVDVSTSPIDLRPGDRYLLCSDGLWGELEDPVIAEVLAREPPANAVDELIDRANARGGRDNVTVLVAALIGADEAPARRSIWTPRTVVAAGLVTAMAIFWRLCA
ncbi:MAG: Stp1/IreP family PP2C-type Ser/Thr phosphatase [Deltaproteobacteria bacterium]|jgi:protein phosphatase|nr:Stp1/IreP family PP2C-type Ser/Thr phosphatase [Deltaproteobacteria bacterium]